MTSNGFEPRSQGRFEATVETEIKHLWRETTLLWQHNSKRRAEIELVEKEMTDKIEVIKARINGAVCAFALAAAGVIAASLKARLGL